MYANKRKFVFGIKQLTTQTTDPKIIKVWIKKTPDDI